MGCKSSKEEESGSANEIKSEMVDTKIGSFDEVLILS